MAEAFARGNANKLRQFERLFDVKMLGDYGMLVAVRQRLAQLMRAAGGEAGREALKLEVSVGESLRQAGKFVEAETALRAVLGKCEAALGEEDQLTLSCVNSLANAVEEQGNLAGAEELKRRALKGREKALGAKRAEAVAAADNAAAIEAELLKLSLASDATKEKMANRILRTWNDRLRSTCLEAWKSYTETCRRAKNEERIHGEMAALKDECAAPRSAPPRPY